MTDTLGRMLFVVFATAVAVGWIAILVPGVVRRLRRDPRPTFPPVPLPQPIGPDGAANASLFYDALRAVVPGSVPSPVDEPNAIGLGGPPPSGLRLVLSLDASGRTDEPGTFYVDLAGLGSDAYFELDMGTDPTQVFWTAVGYLRDGSVDRRGHAFVHVTEAGMWRRFSASSVAGDLERAWVTSPPE